MHSAGTSTNIDGQYTLSLKPGKHTLEFKMVGFMTAKREITLVADQILTLDVTLESEENDLDEIVVVGYGVQRKREVTGSISKIDGKELTKLPVPSFEAALQGQAAGVAVSQGSGMAGSGSLIRVRGIQSACEYQPCGYRIDRSIERRRGNGYLRITRCEWRYLDYDKKR